MVTLQSIDEKLDRILVVTSAPVPFSEQWLDFEGVGAMLSFSKSYVQGKIVTLPDFPPPLRIGGNGHPRWRAQEVAAWAQQRRGGAPA